MKKALGSALALAMLLGLLAGCGGTASSTAAEEPAEAPSTAEEVVDEEPADEEPADTDDTDEPAATGDFKAVMVTDVGGINDESFNQSAYIGMQQLEADYGVDISYIESEKDADYAPNLELAVDGGADIIWGVGFMMHDAIGEAAAANPDQMFGLIDDEFEEGELPNVICVQFHAEQSSFLVGYAAGYMTETDHVGFVLGMESPTMARFTYGFFAGVQYAANEQGKEIRIDYDVAENFGDAAKGKAMAQKMYSDGADIIYHAAGATGNGVIEAAEELDKLVIGVDLDQNHLAPNNVISSGLKNVNVGVYEISERVMNGEDIGGTTVYLGLAEGGVGIATTGNFIPSDVLDSIGGIEAEIASGAIVVPYTEEDYDAFVADLG